jgi:hypothetical protein
MKSLRWHFYWGFAKIFSIDADEIERILANLIFPLLVHYN